MIKHRIFFIIILIILCGVIGSFNSSKSSVPENKVAQNSGPSLNQKNNSYWHRLAITTPGFFNQLGIPLKSKKLNPRVSNLHQTSSEIKASTNQKKSAASSIANIVNPSFSNTSYKEFESTQQTYIYISENGANKVTRCVLNPDSLSDCTDVLTSIPSPQHMVVVNTTLYLVTYKPSGIISCDLTPNGKLEKCTQNKLPIKNPAYIMYSNYNLNITDMALKKNVKCNLEYSFSIENCSISEPIVSAEVLNSPSQRFNTATYREYIYIALYDAANNYKATLNKCIDNNCSVLYDSHLTDPNSVQVFKHTAYITEGNSNSLIMCNILANGSFAPCEVLKSGLNIPVGVAFYSSER